MSTYICKREHVAERGKLCLPCARIRNRRSRARRKKKRENYEPEVQIHHKSAIPKLLYRAEPCFWDNFVGEEFFDGGESVGFGGLSLSAGIIR